MTLLRQVHRLRPEQRGRLYTIKKGNIANASSLQLRPGNLNKGNVRLLSTSARQVPISVKIIRPFIFGFTLSSTVIFYNQCNEEMLTNKDRPDGKIDLTKLYSVYKYLEVSTEGPRLDLSDIIGGLNWQKIAHHAPTRSARGLVYYVWSGLMHGLDSAVAMFPAIDIRPKLVRIGLITQLEEALQSEDLMLQQCAAYIINKLSKNLQCARLLASRPIIMEALVKMCDSELEVANQRFVGFKHSESNTSAEVFVTLMEAMSNILAASLNRETFLIGGPLLSPNPTDARVAMSSINREFLRKIALTLQQMEVDESKMWEAKEIFIDFNIALYKQFFPRHLDDQIRRRMREVEASMSRFVMEVSKHPMGVKMLLDGEMIKGLTPLAITEMRNSSAFLYAVVGMDNIINEYHREKNSYDRIKHQTAGLDDMENPPSPLVMDSRLISGLMKRAEECVVSPSQAGVGEPFLQLKTVSAMRCYISSMACMVGGGIYGLLRVPANHKMDPLLVYSKAGIGAVVLNLLYGSYGVRKWVQSRTFIDDDTTNIGLTWSVAFVDAAVIGAVVSKHPYCLLPFLVVNSFGHGNYPGSGVKRCDGFDCLVSLDH